MITINSKLGTKEEISSLATKLRSVPDDKNNTVCPDVVKKLKQTEFYSVVVDLYKSNEELQFRRDATFLLRRVGYDGDKEDLKELVHRGIVRLILTDCVYSTDADLITNIVTVLRDVCSKHNRFLLSDIAEEGLYDKVIFLLETWKSNDDIAERILLTINTICSYEMTLDEKPVLSNQPRLVTLLRNNHQLLREMISSDTICKVPAAILLYKYLDSIEESELLQLLIPPTNEMFTERGIVKLASNIKAIPGEEEEFEKQVIREVASANFISKFSEQYDSNTEEVYRRNLTYVMSCVSYLGDKAVISSLVNSGVIKHLITTCEHCTDSEVMCNIAGTLQYIAYDNGDFSHVDHLVEGGVLTLISKLLQKWSKDDTVMVRLLGTLQNIACNRVDIMELIAKSTEYSNIPLLLQGLLETASSDSVIDNIIRVIRNLVLGTDVLHTVFIHASFFTTAFRHLQSTTLNSDSKQHLLCGIICTVANKNTDNIKDMLIPHSQPLKELTKTGSDIELSVPAAILLYKYLDSIEESELLQLLIPPTSEMFTEGGIVKLAGIVKAIPDEEEELKKQVIREVVSANFIIKFSEQYDSNTEEVYRRNLTYVIRRVAALGDKAVISSLVNSGVIKHLITTYCEHCTDSEVMCNIAGTLQYIAYDNGDNSHVDHLVEWGVLTLISKLLQKWSKDDTVMVSLLGTLQNITCDRVDIEELIANSTEYGNIPELVTNTLQTSSNVAVLESTIGCIQNMLMGSMYLHEHFSTTQLIDTCISRIKSDELSSEYRITILRFIVTRLTCNHPAKVDKLLVPHIHSLKEIAELDTDSELSSYAAELINTYLSCGEKRHNCVLVNTLFILNILKFFALYIVDIVLDIKVGINAVNDPTLSTRYEGYCLLLFSILPLIYLNYQSILRYDIQCMKRVTVDPVISLQGSNRGRLTKFFFPWRFNSVKHTILNILTVLQLHPLITAFELVYHRSKTLRTLIDNKFHFRRLSTQEKILENVPCTLIKGIILYKFIDSNKSNVSMGSDEYVTLFSTVYGILTLCYKVASFENVCRSADRFPGVLTTCQQLVSFIGVLLSLNSRLIMCLVLFSVMRDNGTMWIFTISVLLHILLSSVTHLLSHHKWQSPYEHSSVSVKEKFVIKDFILRESNSRNSKPVVIGRCALVFCLSWSESFIVSLRHPIDLVSGRIPSTYHLRSGRDFFLIYVLHLLEVIAVTVLANTGLMLVVARITRY